MDPIPSFVGSWHCLTAEDCRLLRDKQQNKPDWVGMPSDIPDSQEDSEASLGVFMVQHAKKSINRHCAAKQAPVLGSIASLTIEGGCYNAKVSGGLGFSDQLRLNPHTALAHRHIRHSATPRGPPNQCTLRNFTHTFSSGPSQAMFNALPRVHSFFSPGSDRHLGETSHTPAAFPLTPKHKHSP